MLIFTQLTGSQPKWPWSRRARHQIDRTLGGLTSILCWQSAGFRKGLKKEPFIFGMWVKKIKYNPKKVKKLKKKPFFFGMWVKKFKFPTSSLPKFYARLFCQATNIFWRCFHYQLKLIM